MARCSWAEHGVARRQPFRPEDIVVKVSISGRLEHDVYYGRGRGLARSPSEEIQRKATDKVDEMTLPMMEEIANMISGRTMIDLEAEGYRRDITTPLLTLLHSSPFIHSSRTRAWPASRSRPIPAPLLI